MLKYIQCKENQCLKIFSFSKFSVQKFNYKNSVSKNSSTTIQCPKIQCLKIQLQKFSLQNFSLQRVNIRVTREKQSIPDPRLNKDHTALLLCDTGGLGSHAHTGHIGPAAMATQSGDGASVSLFTSFAICVR